MILKSPLTSLLLLFSVALAYAQLGCAHRHLPSNDGWAGDNWQRLNAFLAQQSTIQGAQACAL